MSYTLGILGGLGPSSSAFFYESICNHTKAYKDQDHLDIIISSKATTPDRTAYILDSRNASPIPYMVSEAKKLEKYGADSIVIACNTAHYFIDEVRKAVSIPVPSIITETINYLYKTGKRKIGIMGTSGTVASCAYQNECDSFGIDYSIPSAKDQDILMDIIYNSVKENKYDGVKNKLTSVIASLSDTGCDSVILGCTELSLAGKLLEPNPFVTDSLEVLAYKSIIMSGHTPIGFKKDFSIIK